MRFAILPSDRGSRSFFVPDATPRRCAFCLPFPVLNWFLFSLQHLSSGRTSWASWTEARSAISRRGVAALYVRSSTLFPFLVASKVLKTSIITIHSYFASRSTCVELDVPITVAGARHPTDSTPSDAIFISTTLSGCPEMKLFFILLQGLVKIICEK